MKKESLYSLAILIFVTFTVGLMEVLKRITSDLTIPFTIIILSLIGGIAISWISWNSAKSGGSKKHSIILQFCAILLFGFGAYLTLSTFIL